MTEPRTRSWMPPIPGPLQRLFDHFPLVTYPANELPARSPRPGSLPTLYIFASEEGAARGLPSYNPSCLKWQTLLRLSDIPHLTVPSTNHASPTGSLPYLQPPPKPAPTSAQASQPQLPPPPPPRPIPSASLEQYILLTSTSTPSPLPITPTSALGPELTLRQDPYLSLLSGPIRAAWLTALYLDPANAPLLEALYIAPASSSPIVRAALLRQLRQAAESEVVRILYPTSSSSSGGWKLSVNGFLEFGPGATRKPAAVVDYKEIYDRAEKAWESLAELLAESETGWFFGVEKPGVFDAAVFAYSHLVENRESQEGEEGKGLRWRDGGRLDGMVRGAGRGELIEHRERIWEMCWGGDREGWKGE